VRTPAMLLAAREAVTAPVRRWAYRTHHRARATWYNTIDTALIAVAARIIGRPGDDELRATLERLNDEILRSVEYHARNIQRQRGEAEFVGRVRSSVALAGYPVADLQRVTFRSTLADGAGPWYVRDGATLHYPGGVQITITLPDPTGALDDDLSDRADNRPGMRLHVPTTA
jgi:hypothetical protein